MEIGQAFDYSLDKICKKKKKHHKDLTPMLTHAINLEKFLKKINAQLFIW